MLQMSVEEAKSKGIDVDALEKKDAETDVVPPFGTKPSSAAIADLEEKTQALKVNDVPAAAPLANGSEPASEQFHFEALAPLTARCRSC
jgi:hypothetical protein